MNWNFFVLTFEGEVEWSIPVLLMDIMCVETKLESSPSQGWWLAYHSFFSELTMKVSTFTWSRLVVSKIEVSHFYLFCLDYWNRWRPSLYHHCGRWTLFLCTGIQDPLMKQWVALTSAITTLLFTYLHVLE